MAETPQQNPFQAPAVWIVIVVAFILGAIIGFPKSGDTTNQTEAPTNTTATPPEEKQLETLKLSGKGQQATEKFELNAGLVVFKLKHTGDANFIVHLLDDQGNDVEGLVNEIGNFSGSKAVQIPDDGKYLLDVEADGAWSITVDR